MRSTWFCLPSCRPKAEADACFAKWKALGYRIAILRQGDAVDNVDIQIPTPAYLGWAKSTNILAKHVIINDRHASWIVGGGDDYCPDLEHDASLIGMECVNHFSGTFGVMQPTGDRWGDEARSRARYGEDRGAYIDRVAGSPWMGREWIERSYQGFGPMWDGYHHCFADEELQEVAIKLGVFWQRRDLVQYHDHAGRKSQNIEDWPPHLLPAITGANWDRDKAMFADRKGKGFPGHEALPL